MTKCLLCFVCLLNLTAILSKLDEKSLIFVLSLWSRCMSSRSNLLVGSGQYYDASHLTCHCLTWILFPARFVLFYFFFFNTYNYRNINSLNSNSFRGTDKVLSCHDIECARLTNPIAKAIPTFEDSIPAGLSPSHCMHCPFARHRSPLLRSSRPIRASERCGLRGIPPYRLHVTWPSRPSPLATVEVFTPH